MPENKTIKVGVLLNGETINRYAANALEEMVENTSGSIRLLVINSDKGEVNEAAENSPSVWIEKAWRLIKNHGIWSIAVLRRNIFPLTYTESVHISDITCLDQSERIYTQPLPADRLGNELPDSVVGEIKNSCDVVIRFGFGILKGDVLSAPDYGVLSFHHGDIRKYRGRAGGFWAYINNDPEAGVTLQQLNETLDGGKIAVYESANIEDTCSFQEVRCRIHKISQGMLAEAISKIEHGGFQPYSPEILGSLYTERNLIHIVKFVIKSIKDRIKCVLG